MFDDKNDNNKHIHQAKNTPYLFFFFISIFIGMLITYVFLDLYVQKKVDLSLIQIVKIVKKHNEVVKHNKKEKPMVYKLMINGDEHNFSFTDFRLLNLKIDDIILKR